MTGGMAGRRRPRVLLTGFSVFPGAPLNPTEVLVGSLRETPPAIDADLKLAVLSVEYDTISAQLAAICADFQPDIALHFGLARECRGFRLERVARNTNAKARPDNLGNMPAAAAICAGPDTIASTLPLDEMERRFAAAGLPVEWSDDAGGYLCNTVFTLSAAHACDGLRPAMTGFIHVPPLDGDAAATGTTMSLADLRRGAEIVLSAAVDAWSAK